MGKFGTHPQQYRSMAFRANSAAPGPPAALMFAVNSPPARVHLAQAGPEFAYGAGVVMFRVMNACNVLHLCLHGLVSWVFAGLHSGRTPPPVAINAWALMVLLVLWGTLWALFPSYSWYAAVAPHCLFGLLRRTRPASVVSNAVKSIGISSCLSACLRARVDQVFQALLFAASAAPFAVSSAFSRSKSRLGHDHV